MAEFSNPFVEREDKQTYKIKRQYFKSGRKRILFTGKSLAWVQAWCSREDSKKVKRNGEIVWMDCFYRE